MAGLDANGLEIKRFVEIVDDVNEGYQASFGNDINIDEDSVLSQIRDTLSLQLASLWELSQAVYDSQSPSRAEGQQLDDNTEIVGISRIEATQSQVLVLIRAVNSTVIPVTFNLLVNTTEEKFHPLVADTVVNTNANRVTIDPTNVLDSTAYTITVDAVPYIFNSDASATKQEIVTGLVAAFSGNAQSLSATDNGDETLIINSTNNTASNSYTLDVNMSFVDVSTLVSFVSEEYGEIEGPAGTITQLEGPLSGFRSATNPLSATLGVLEETDAQLRVRRNESLTVTGRGTLESILSRLRSPNEITGVTYVYGRENVTAATDAFSLPAKSFEIIVEGGDDDDIAEILWKNKPAGILTYSDSGDSGSATDSNGNTQTLNFTRPTAVPIYVEVNYTLYAEEAFPANGPQLIADIILEEGNALVVDEDVISQRFHGPIFAQIDGLETLTVKISTSASPTLTTTIAIDERERSSFDAANIAVV